MDEIIIKAENGLLANFTDASEGIWKGPFTFIQAADTQFGMIEDYIEHKEDPQWTKEIALTKHTVRIVNAMRPKPRFFIICGDLTHAWPGADNKPLQEADLKEALSALDPDIPTVCVCGNHDIGNRPTPESIGEYRNNWGDDHFTFWLGGVKCIVINSQFYEDRSLVEELGRRHDDWLMRELSRTTDCGINDRPQHLLVFQHIPWFLDDPDEDDQYFNIDRNIRAPWLQKMADAGVSKIFCGHYHRNAGGWCREPKTLGDADPGLELVVTSAIGAQIGNDGSGFRVVTVGEQGITHQYHRIEDYPQHAT